VGDHHVRGDLEQLEWGEHRVAVQEAALADPDPGVAREGQPAAGLEQRPLSDLEPFRIERLQRLTLERVADEEPTGCGVTVDPEATAPAMVALVPAALHPPGAPLSRRRHVRSFTERAGGYRLRRERRLAAGPARRHRPRWNQDP